MKSIAFKYITIIISVLITLAIYDLSKTYSIEAKSYYKSNLEQKLSGYEEVRAINSDCNSEANLKVSSTITKDNIDEWNDVNSSCRLKHKEKLQRWIAFQKYSQKNMDSFKGTIGKFINDTF
ncbi:hypothetical protein [Shewanella sp. 10N.286.48.B5]|uniref:hypothetical protein n=1 Tax=Shewanella sp. 10N.286.48.B5 TaxID=1880834 RepID=UPI000C822B0F|nr:hypothetical protein [Shewanella sp. 10N.286.48.B5]PMH85772.1 hypothetical protein BCU57_12860 [Shewanella sp. 10N.286.48.B5]